MAPWIESTRGWGGAGSTLRRALFAFARARSRSWCAPHAQLLRELGQEPDPEPLFSVSRSEWLSLCMFPASIGAPQPDWPASFVQCGFPDAQATHTGGLPEALERFLEQGAPPIVFTLGSAAVHAAGSFYFEASKACLELGARAVFLTGEGGINPLGALPPEQMAFDYAPLRPLFERSLACVHACGIGTCAASLSSGAPTLCVPWANDQPDNARRLASLGVARILPRKRFEARAAARELSLLLSDPGYRLRARGAARSETGAAPGAQAAAAALMAKLEGRARGQARA